MKIVQEIRGTTAENDAWLFPSGVVTVDESLRQLRLHDGVTPGGVVIPNSGNILEFGTLEFTGVMTASVPGALLDSTVGKFINFTAAGTYDLPTVVGVDVGQRIILRAQVAGIVIAPYAGESISDLNVDQTVSISINQNQIAVLCVLDTDSWVVLSRY